MSDGSEFQVCGAATENAGRVYHSNEKAITEYKSLIQLSQIPAVFHSTLTSRTSSSSCVHF